ncbi:MAG: LLM class F420-dependent oxidoreductase [Streptosporangiales bacterium]|nr:LLM class F420-dependent oxidoreductase [Streptosporangiales bacterium]MBO0892328.1 LLM class F420-dependent oxidoreductase [Acidothermales bacterium]
MELIVFTEPQQGASYDDQLRVARAAEDLGFAGFFRSDHYLHMGGVDPAPGPTDSWTTLAGLARETSRIRLGTLVSSATFRYPGPLAIQVAQVDQMSGGRVELGIGAGWYAAEHDAYAVPFPGVRERFDRLAEQLAVILGLWRNPDGERFGFRGTYYQVDDSPGLPKPVQRPHPPVIVGGMGKRRTPELAAAYADEFNAAFVSVDDASRQYARVTEACGQAHRDLATLRFSTALTVFCGKDEAEVRRRADAVGSGSIDPDTALVGTPAHIVDRIGAYVDAGAKRVYLQVLDLHDADHLELIASEVLPQLG